jgi:hypothetical protein
MKITDKQEFIQAFFCTFEQRVKRLQRLRESFEEEAFTLCLVYIDRLASGHFGGKDGQNRKNYSRALKQLSGNPLFGMIHPGQLKKLAQDRCPFASSFIESLISKQPNALLREDDLAAEINKSSFSGEEKSRLVSNLWRASIANIAYDHIRVAEIHGPGSNGLSFDGTVYDGHTGVTLDFQKFHDALCQILEQVKEASLNSGHWFGNPNYMRERQ